MTLHEAIIKVLNESAKARMSASEIADVLNRKKYYTKGDASLISASQISARVNKYTEVFKKVDGEISLSNTVSILSKTSAKFFPLKLSSIDTNTTNWNLMEKILLNENNLKDCYKSEKSIPDKPGIYCIQVKRREDLPEIFAQELKVRRHNIIYFGIASQSLRKRFFKQELRAKGHGTFFRSLGAILNFRPLKGSLVGKANKRNYKFTAEDERKIIEWINQNLLINWIEISENLNELETQLIVKYQPLLNISKNNAALSELSVLRAECIQIANSDE